MRIKQMPVEQFSDVIKRDWVPVQLTSGAIPTWLQNIPSRKLHSIYASGGPYSETKYTDGAIPASELIGGIDVYRNAYDDPVLLNKDWYAVIQVNSSDPIYLLAGPIKDHEHWLNELPMRLQNVEILSVPPKPQGRNFEAE